MDALLTLHNLFALLTVLAGAIARGYTGFGSGLIMVPLLALLWGPIEAIIFTLTLGLLATAQMTIPAARIANWRDIAPICAVALLAATLLSLAVRAYKGPSGILPSAIFGAIVSSIYGVGAVRGPVHVIYLISLSEKAKVQRANIAILTGVMGVSVLLYTLVAGDVTWGIIDKILIFAMPYILGVWGGTKMFRLLPEATFKRVILWFLLIICLAILVI